MNTRRIRKTKYLTILFDLDGTVTDSALGITKSIQYAAEKMNLLCPPLSALTPFVGPPLRETFQAFFHLTQEQAMEAVCYYRERFSAVGMFENAVYDGIEALLRELAEAGYTLLLASSKPEPYARKILEHFQLAQYFSYIGGSKLDGSRTSKAEVIEYVLKQQRILDRTRVVMVGDTYYDVEGARQCGLSAVAVGYGYGEREKLLSCAPEFYAETVQALSDYFLEGEK